jgi:hypothetical protein
MADPLAINPEPAGGFSFKQMLPTLVIDVAMPIVRLTCSSGMAFRRCGLCSQAGCFRRSTISASGPGRGGSNPSESS